MTRHTDVIRAILLGLVFLLALPRSVRAHNGAVAIAVPLEGITIDGDLSDWPEGLKRCPVRLLRTGVGPVDAEDYQGTFRVGYHAGENVLYLAVEVEDESTVIDTTTGARWDPQDGCDVFIRGLHGPGEPPLIPGVQAPGIRWTYPVRGSSS